MNNEKIHKLREKLMDELEKCYKDAPLDTATMETIYKLSKSIKAIDTICAMDEGNSYRGRWPMSYDEGKTQIAHKLKDLMRDTENEHTRGILRNAINQLEMS